MRRLSEIEAKLRRSGTDPSVILTSSDRTCLDRVSVPRRFACASPCCKFGLTYFTCLFVVMVFDFFNTARYIGMTVESSIYGKNYPVVVLV